MELIILLSVVCGIQLILLIVIGRAALKISRLVQAYETFFEDTLEDVNSVIEMMDTLKNRRQMLSDDPDVQNIYRVVVILHDILVGYRDATKKERKEKEK